MNLVYKPSLALKSDTGHLLLKPYYKGIPTYVYNIAGIVNRYRHYKAAFNGDVDIHYAVKANTHPEILKALAAESCGADVVSGGEIALCLEAGFKASDMVYSGVGKTKKELTYAIELGLKEINVESPSELNRIRDIATALNKPVNLSLRMNPDVNPETHPYIKTGFRDNKFGMDVSFLPELIKTIKSSPLLRLKGLSIHIGSQILETHSYVEAVSKMWPVFDELESEGFDLDTFNVGGGLGIQYENFDKSKDFDLVTEFGQAMSEVFKARKCKILCEPGRMLVGPEAVLLTEVEYIKKTPYKNFAIVNTGMHHLLRPALYQSYHQIVSVDSSETSVKYDVVGPICESSDVIGVDRSLPKLEEGDLLAILDVGAYGASMASGYNSHPMAEEVVINN